MEKSPAVGENTALNQSPLHFLFHTIDETEMTKEEEAAFREYLDSQDSPALYAMERAGDRGPVPYSPAAYDEMVRQDLEGLS